MESLDNIQPCQIVYLEVNGDRLYTEVIQIVIARGLAWVRPLILVKSTENDSPLLTDLPPYYDVRQGPDLLWPVHAFHLAFDTEVIPIITHLGAMHPTDSNRSEHHQQLRSFIDRLWNLHQNPESEH
ncbi:MULTISPECIES: hypothetical protein [unclassified Roseofilum]|uniref:hypothetical protein n=1 Tax=unclassified Roseofilum TaxID=2620099 RepID=UPI000E9B6287|nr:MULTISPECIES: hypothetical protein [unclassified Roseofilum]HBR00890.1 hypothetical protein [Cyanobacteria bacterium UBA11691]MBP0008255.1 hypothetical protein [Roseofilum sp. Belize Diploria]MBP0012876.1 hypothetical protein [Roseofilum sp. SID3]MBP0025536.1 hypothetical protein [Roseofilum sp. SID2]MBP0032774.1 hypothetical protein [Roseofilum sp. Belize BBD 4]